MSDTAFHVLINNQQAGPYTLDQLRGLWQTGTIDSATLFWQPGQSGWEPLAQLSSLLNPPPLPPQLPPSPRYSSQPSQQPSPPTLPVARPETSALAILSLVFGILGFFTGITSIPAIICGYASRGNIKRSRGALTGDGMALAGVILGYVCLAAVIVIGFLYLTALGTAQERGREIKDLSYAKQIAVAIKLYAIDHHNRTPPNLAALVPDYIPMDEIFISAVSRNQNRDGFEYLLPDRDLESLPDPETTPLLRSHYVSTRHHRIYVYVDAHADVKSEP